MSIFFGIVSVLFVRSQKSVLTDSPLYLFTKKKEREAYVLKHVSYGGGCINDTVVHLATSYMPFKKKLDLLKKIQ